jgi:hypothetical protein
VPRSKQPPYWENGDHYTLTEYDIADGEFEFDLTYVPFDESVSATWMTVPQEPGEYNVDPQGTITWPLEGFEEAGQDIWFRYPHMRQRRDRDTPTPVSWVTYLETQTTTGLITEAPIPVAARRHDLCAFMMFSGFGEGAQFEMNDPRFEQVAEFTLRSRTAGLWVTRLGSDRSPVQIQLQGGVNAYGQFAHATAMVLRGETRANWQLHRTADSGGQTGGSGVLPALPAGGTGAVAFIFSDGGTGGGYPITPPAPWTDRFEVGSYNVVSAATHVGDGTPATAGPPTTDPDDVWRCIVIGVT